MQVLHPSILQALGRLRAEQLMREAEEHRAALLAAQPIPECAGRVARAVAWWRSHLWRRRAEGAPLAEQEQP